MSIDFLGVINAVVHVDDVVVWDQKRISDKCEIVSCRVGKSVAQRLKVVANLRFDIVIKRYIRGVLKNSCKKRNVLVLSIATEMLKVHRWTWWSFRCREGFSSFNLPTMSTRKVSDTTLPCKKISSPSLLPCVKSLSNRPAVRNVLLYDSHFTSVWNKIFWWSVSICSQNHWNKRVECTFILKHLPSLSPA